MKLSLNRLKDVLSYNEIDGIFTWKLALSKRISVGSVAGTPTAKGYIKIRIDYSYYQAHILAWYYMTGEWPSEMLDHINGVGTDNRMTNLRLADSAQNNANSRMRKDNTSGVKGVWFDKSKNKWVARIKFYGKVTRKQFETLEAASTWITEQRQEIHGEFAKEG